ncbi:hypothetical protein ABPG77_010670 [Micractinium sp. CCAP 211/92]
MIPNDPYSEVRIVGGTAAPTNRYPYFASLRDSSGNHFCGATLIAPNVLVTAAHCVAGGGSRALPQVHIGRSFLTAPEAGYDVRQATRVAVHPAYNASNSQNDIAVVLLDAPSSKATLALPSSSTTSALADGTPVVAIGFGTTSEGALYLSDSLQHVTVSYIAYSRCRTLYGGGQLQPGMLCAGVLDGGKDTCQTVGGTACPGATPSPSFPGAAYLPCGRDAPAGSTPNAPTPSPNSPGSSGSGPLVTLFGAGQIAGVGGLNLGASSSSPSSGGPGGARSEEDTSAGDPCRCSATGASGGVQTGRRGCAMHGFPADTTRHCYVVGGISCTAPGVSPSPSFPGAAWKLCRSNAD